MNRAMLPFRLRSIQCQFILLASLVLSFNQNAQAEDDSLRSKFIGKDLYILEDRLGERRIQDVVRSHDFVRCEQDVPNLGVTKSTYWMRFPLLNRGPLPSILLHVPHSEIDELDVYLVGPNGIDTIASTGQSRITIYEKDELRNFAFRIPIPVDSTRSVFVRVRSGKQLHVPITITAEAGFNEVRAERSMAIGAYIGLMLVMALYNLFVFSSIRSRTYLVYVIYILAVTLTQLTFFGIGQFHLWGGSPWWAQRASIILTIITALAASEFMRSFLETRKTLPGMDRWTKWFYIALIGAGLIYAFLDAQLGYQLVQLGSGLFATWLLLSGIKSKQSGSRQAGFFLLAWSAFLIGVVVYVLKDTGLLPYTNLTINLMPLGSAVEAVLLSFGLADRINVLRREKEQSQAEALASSLENERIIREQNVILEEKVTERTHALQETNEHLKQTQTQLVNAEKMASLGQLTAGIAHEINNPINFITSNIQPLRRNISEIVEVIEAYRNMDPLSASEELKELRIKEQAMGLSDSIEELDDIIGSISEGSNRTAEIVRGLRNFSRLDEDDLKYSDIHEGIRSTLSLLAPQCRENLRIQLNYGELPLVECFPGKVNQVLMNILTNSIQATQARKIEQEGIVSITTSVVDDHVLIEIADNGIGMTEEVRTRMFDPFFTTKPVGEGTGLGLAIVYGIIEDHHGHIEAESTVGVGTTFRIHLPVRHGRMNELRA